MAARPVLPPILPLVATYVNGIIAPVPPKTVIEPAMTYLLGITPHIARAMDHQAYQLCFNGYRVLPYHVSFVLENTWNFE
jgi:hypothetical protein